MTKAVLKSTEGCNVYVREGGSCVCTFVFKDALNVELSKASLLTLTMTLREAETATVINGKLNVNVKDANNGTVSDIGVLTLKLLAADNIIIGPATIREKESHLIELKWTYVDLQGVTMPGADTFEMFVCGSSY